MSRDPYLNGHMLENPHAFQDDFLRPSLGGEWQRALLLLSLARAKLKANHVVYNAAISACCLARLDVALGREIWKTIP